MHDLIDLRTDEADAARLVWADAVGGERGELIVIQVMLERGDLAPRDAIAYRKRQRELLARHGVAWSGLADLARRVTYRRGFVDAAEVAFPTLLGSAAELRAQAPLLTSLTVTGVDDLDMLAALVRIPLIRELQGLAIVGSSRLELASAEGLGQLRAFGFAHGRVRLGALHPLARFERLQLPNALDGAALIALLRDGSRSVRALDLGRVPPEVMALIPGVRELQLDGIDDAGLAALATAPVAQTLERLTLHGVRLAALGERFAAFPRLRSLAIRGVARVIDGVRVRTLPALRELALQIPLHEAATCDVAKRLGPQLELLDLTGNPHALRHVHTLKQHVAGELLVSPRIDHAPPLLRDGPTPQMAWWDHVAL